MKESYAAGDVSGSTGVGGLLGIAGDNNDDVIDSYARGDVDGSEKVGGLIGENNGGVTNSYATGDVDGSNQVGGLIGSSTSFASTTESYWDVPASGLDSSDGGIGLGSLSDDPPADEMTGDDAPSGFNMDGFAFTETWETVTDPGDYPILAWQKESGDGDSSSPVDGVSDDLWTAVTQDDGSDSLSLADLGNAIQEYQKNPSDADVGGVSITLSDLGSLIQYYRTEVVEPDHTL